MAAYLIRDPLGEAQAVLAVLDDDHVARVLEPSPPADMDPAWYANDPTEAQGADGTVVSVAGGDATWDDMAARDERIEAFARRHSLLTTEPLAPMPADVAVTRTSLHQLAFFAIAPWRFASTGKLGLRWTRDGFGTPFTRAGGVDVQVRMEGDHLVVQSGATVRSVRPATLREACDFLAMPYEGDWFAGFHDPLESIGPDEPLPVGRDAAVAIGAWFGFATHVLEVVRRTPGATDVGRVQLWPEHLDPAVEVGDAERGRRASHGASPGDDHHPSPYLYVAPWGDVDRSDDFWNDRSFAGASLSYEALQESNDPHAVALQFFRDGMARLAQP